MDGFRIPKRFPSFVVPIQDFQDRVRVRGKVKGEGEG
jgi:hypothetical protein